MNADTEQKIVLAKILRTGDQAYEDVTEQLADLSDGWRVVAVRPYSRPRFLFVLEREARPEYRKLN
ncbi:MAG: hypothetical protein GY719_30540 [bacterium]|nr:hypothetical protein [bacterium]